MKTILRAAIVLLVLGLSGCAGLLGPRDVVLPLPRLQQALESRFPYDQRYLALFDVSLSQPRLSARPDVNRVALQLATRVVPVLTNQSWNGSLILSGSLQVNAEARTLVLAQPRIEQFALDGVDAAYASQISRIGSVLAQQLLTEVPLYHFEPADFRHLGVSFTPVRILVRADALVVTFEPVK
jgi:hypothetical protein